MGGGKRGIAETTTKMTIEAKKKALADEIGLFHVKAQMSQTQLSVAVAGTINQITEMVNSNPKTVASAIFQSLPNANLKSIAGLTGITHTDKKVMAMSQYVFADKTQSMEHMKKSFVDCEMALKNAFHLALLCEFGGDDIKGNSWQNVSTALMEIMEKRTSADADL